MSTVEKVKDSWEPQSYPIPKHWKYVGIDSFFSNISLSGKKLPQKEYLETGSFPVVDQGANLIGGFSNDEDKVISTEIPVVVFGDHTKCLKYITFSFIPGADGIKVLQPKGLVNPKYAFFACQSLKLPDRGYSRHFSFLKKSQFPLAPLEEQKSIVAKIEELFSELDSGVASLKTAQEQLKIYRQALLKHAFEGKLTEQWRKDNANKLETPEQLLARIQTERETRYQQQLDEWKQAVKDWEAKGKEGKRPSKPTKLKPTQNVEEQDFQIPTKWALAELSTLAYEGVLGKMLDKQKNTGVDQDYLGNINVRWGYFDLNNLKQMKIEETEESRYSLNQGDLVVCEGGEPGRCAIWKGENGVIFIQKALHRIRFTESYLPTFAYYYLTYAVPLERVVKHFTGTTIKHLTGTGLGKVQFPICSLAEQQEIVSQLEEKLSIIEQNEKEIEDALTKAELLRQSILKKAFSGRLIRKN